MVAAMPLTRRFEKATAVPHERAEQPQHSVAQCVDRRRRPVAGSRRDASGESMPSCNMKIDLSSSCWLVMAVIAPRRGLVAPIYQCENLAQNARTKFREFS